MINGLSRITARPIQIYPSKFLLRVEGCSGYRKNWRFMIWQSIYIMGNLNWSDYTRILTTLSRLENLVMVKMLNWGSCCRNPIEKDLMLLIQERHEVIFSQSLANIHGLSLECVILHCDASWSYGFISWEIIISRCGRENGRLEWRIDNYRRDAPSDNVCFGCRSHVQTDLQQEVRR